MWSRWDYVIYHDLGRADHFGPAPVAALEHFQDGAGGQGGVVSLGKRVMVMWIKRLADNLVTLEAMLTEQFLQLLQGHFHALMQSRGNGGNSGGQGTLQIVNDRQ